MGGNDNVNLSISALLKDTLMVDRLSIEEAISKLNTRLSNQKLKIDTKQIEEFSKIIDSISILQTNPKKEISNTCNKIKDTTKLNYLSNLISYAYLSLSINDFTKSFLDSIEIVNDIEKKYIKYTAILLKYGWTPAKHITLPEINKIIELYDSDIDRKQALINKKIITFYRKELLEDVLNEWSKRKILQDRLDILKNIIDAHISGKYSLAVPVLLAQIEGVIAKGFCHKGQMHEPCYKAYINEILSFNPHNGYNILISDFFVNSMMVDFTYGEPVGSKTSRHAILHGADTNYGTEENSLKLILFLDYIQSKFQYFSCNSSNVYHLAGCNMVHPISRDEAKTEPSNISEYFVISTSKKKRYFTKNMIFYENEDTPILNGLRPCKMCIAD
ncbi:hypothetical protein Cpap_4028 [Ruminiclostridium papyrosolvens DSM 2782]|uniref:Uncharacterized protein n=1 Tax=Ruminiclostridium papyrosolvens DSM 2782 TaxID=588581 RepID=F1T7Z2_9FIRM|nr:hypothetical protein [Ruminiclostridium papyrosolvens]EGD49590.1 hypothetical protein Cpap_4028 [Ruminiclostridium papyrosolvens DSM 2782]WES33284.1 hypothetical protein P0092_16160 [Ruminiclostridium papyrosolvens DSM 2782]